MTWITTSGQIDLCCLQMKREVTMNHITGEFFVAPVRRSLEIYLEWSYVTIVTYFLLAEQVQEYVCRIIFFVQIQFTMLSGYSTVVVDIISILFSNTQWDALLYHTLLLHVNWPL